MSEMLTKGGPIVFLILGASVLALGVVIERFLYLRRGARDSSAFMPGLLEAFESGGPEEALAYCEGHPCPVAEVIKMGLLAREEPPDEIRSAMQDAADGEIPRLQERFAVLATVIYIAPLLGFLGTVQGMIAAFRAVEKMGAAADTRILAGGIWTALLTTAAGLAVAIPAHVLYAYLRSRVAGIVLKMEQGASGLLLLIKEHRKDG